MKIKVTQEHINRGNICEPFGCPVALAAKDAGAEYGSVGVREITLVKNGPSFLLPKRVTQFILAFDMNNAVEPFEFEINTMEAPTEVRPIENLRIG